MSSIELVVSADCLRESQDSNALEIIGYQYITKNGCFVHTAKGVNYADTSFVDGNLEEALLQFVESVSENMDLGLTNVMLTCKVVDTSSRTEFMFAEIGRTLVTTDVMAVLSLIDIAYETKLH